MKNKLHLTHQSLTLGWLYPELMSTYGDRGNIIVLQKISEDNNIQTTLKRINQNSKPDELGDCDLLFMGGAQDLQQEIVNRDLIENKQEVLKELIEDGIPGLYICGAYQFLGKYYQDAYGTKIPGLGVFDMHTESYKTKPRLIGNIVVSPNNIILRENEVNREVQSKSSRLRSNNNSTLVGFENHGGRTFLTDKSQAFAKVVKGFGNNGEDHTEGIHYKNSIGTYLHGPILPSNPELAVYLLETALQKKYGETIMLKYENTLAQKARDIILKNLNI